MSDKEDRVTGNGPEEFTALRQSASEADARLARALDALYPEALPPADPADWAALEGAATRFCGARRRRRLLHDLWSSLGHWRFALGGMVAAAVLIVGVVAIGNRRPASITERDPAILGTPRARIEGGSSARLATLLGRATINVFGTVDVDQGDPLHTQVLLSAGSVAVQVPHLPSSGTFVVDTEEAEVVVHGTRFTVAREPPGNTTVRVDEGVVEVRPRGGHRPPQLLRPGERAVVPGLALYFADLEHRLDDLLTAADCQSADPIIAHYLEAAPTGRDVSAALYLRGYCSAQRGDEVQAMADFERVTVAAGDGVRRDNAAARVAQVRAAHDPVAGRAAWRRYLERFPDGIHRGLAQQFLAGTGGRH